MKIISIKANQSLDLGGNFRANFISTEATNKPKGLTINPFNDPTLGPCIVITTDSLKERKGGAQAIMLFTTNIEHIVYMPEGETKSKKAKEPV